MKKANFFSLFEIDLRSLVAFRVVAGLLAIYDGLIKFPHLRWLYTADGYRGFSAEEFPRAVPIHELISHLTLTHWQLLIVAQLCAGVFLIIGWRPKFWLVVWLIVIRFTMRRNNVASHIGDLVFTFFLYAILFLPLKFPQPGKFLKQKIKVGPYQTLPFITQLFCLYFFAGFTKLQGSSWLQGVFFIRDIQSEGVWEKYSSVAQYPELLRAVSYALPYFQISVSVLLLLLWRYGGYRLFYILFFLTFHLFGFLLVPEATMYWFLNTPLILLLPPSFWDFWARVWKQTPVVYKNIKLSGKKSIQNLKKSVAVGACLVFFSSNFFALYFTENEIAARYLQCLGKVFLYQQWFVFHDFASEHYQYEFSFKSRPDSKPVAIPNQDRTELITGRFAVMKRALFTAPGRERWTAALCLDLQEQKNDSQMYSITIKRYLRKFTDIPPLAPVITYVDEQEYNCQSLIEKHMGRYN